MYAVVRESIFDPSKLAQGSDQLAEFQVLRARQPGYQGNLVVDAGNGRLLTITLYGTEEQATAARAVLEPEAQRLLRPLMTAPSQVIGSGPVVVTDLTQA